MFQQALWCKQTNELFSVLYQLCSLSFFINNFVKKSSSWEADSFWDTREIPFLLWKAMVRNFWAGVCYLSLLRAEEPIRLYNVPYVNGFNSMLLSCHLSRNLEDHPLSTVWKPHLSLSSISSTSGGLINVFHSHHEGPRFDAGVVRM
jgi:hypothetical protein